MRQLRAGGLAVVIGLTLLLVPVYRGFLMAIGIAVVLDPIAAVGFYGGYPVAVGGVTVAIGSAVLLRRRSTKQVTTVFLVGGVTGAVFGIISLLLLTSVPIVWAVQLGLAGAASGFAAVRGAATTQAKRRLGTGLVVLSLSPFTTGQIVRGATHSGLAGAVSVIIVLALVVYTAVLSYPLSTWANRPMSSAYWPVVRT